MRLVGSLLGFVARKLGLFAGLVLVLFAGFLLAQVVVPSIREAVSDRERLQRVTEERLALENDLERLRTSAEEGQLASTEFFETQVAAEVASLGRRVTDARSEAERLTEAADAECSLLQQLGDLVTPGDACDAAEQAAEAARSALATIEESLEEAEGDAAVLADPDLTAEQKLDRIGQGGGESSVERQIDTAQSELGRTEAEQERLEQAQSSPAGWIVRQWSQSWRWLAGLALLLILLPPLLRTLSYFVLMPVVHRVHTPLLLADGPEHATAELATTAAQRTLTIDLDADEVLSARSEYVRPVQGQTRSRLLYDWSSPFISYAAGLSFLSRVTGGESVTSATLASPDDPDSYLMRIDFSDHPGVVIHPRHVVGVIGEPRLETRWSWGIQSFATAQVRYIMFAGDGGLVVQGSGDVVATDPRGGSTRIEQHLVMGFDARLVKGVNRTEVFWPYLRGREPLVDDEFTGAHQLFWQKSSGQGPSNPLARTFDSLFSAIGKVLGF